MDSSAAGENMPPATLVGKITKFMPNGDIIYGKNTLNQVFLHIETR